MERFDDLPEEVLALTFDQLRTLLFLVHEGSPRKAALALGRDQSSVVKQVELLNESFQKLCGEPLAIKRGRGEDYAFTQTCKEIADLVEQLLDNWSAYLERRRREVGQRLVIATTTFTLRILAQLWDEVAVRVPRRAELEVTQIRTKGFWDSLRDRSVDLVIGAVVSEQHKQPYATDYDFLEWSRDNFCFLTNLSRRVFPGDMITWDELRNYPLILPEAGVIIDAIRIWYGNDYQRKLKLVSPVLDVHYARELLYTRTVEGFMVSTHAVAKHLESELPNTSISNIDEQQKKTRTLRPINLGTGFQKLDLVSGLFGRKGERALYELLDKRHPLVLFWEVFEQHVKSGRN
jgi:DNA-binding transcriptional LysR family regulator